MVFISDRLCFLNFSIVQGVKVACCRNLLVTRKRVPLPGDKLGEPDRDKQQIIIPGEILPFSSPLKKLLRANQANINT